MAGIYQKVSTTKRIENSAPREQMVSGAFDCLSHIMETYFSEPDERKVSDEIAEVLMRSVIANTRKAVENPKNYADELRDDSWENHSKIRIVDFDICSMDIFNHCGNSSNILMVAENRKDVHPMLKVIPVD